MQINKSHSINFGSRHLYSATLKSNNFLKRDIPVFISELELSDKPRISKQIENWATTDYGKIILNKFVRDNSCNISYLGRSMKYLAVETKKGKIKAVAIAEDLTENNWHISMLQSERQKSGNKSLSGAGSCILYALSRLSHSSGKKFATLHATQKSYPFYDKVGFHRVSEDSLRYFLPKTQFAEFEKRMEQKYSIKPLIPDIDYEMF